MNTKLMLALSCSLLATMASAKILACNTKTAVNTECITTLDNLHPGQPDVGLYVVNMDTPKKGMLEKFAKECKKSYDDLKDDIKERGNSKAGIAGVIDQHGIVYIINGHHHTYALNELKSSPENKCDYEGEVYVYITANQSHLSDQDFSKYMQDHKLVWLHNSSGHNISYPALPASLKTMGNSPYRSVIKLVEDSQCNADNPVIDTGDTTPYLEFIWADRLYKYNQSFMHIDTKNAADYAVDSYNYIVNNFSKFADLPGALTPKSKTCSSFK